MPKLATTMLTDVLVKDLKTKGTDRMEVRDAVARGLGLRVNGSTSKTWFVMKRVKGKQKRVRARRATANLAANIHAAKAGLRGDQPVKDHGLEETEGWRVPPADQDQCKSRGLGPGRSREMAGSPDGEEAWHSAGHFPCQAQDGLIFWHSCLAV